MTESLTKLEDGRWLVVGRNWDATEGDVIITESLLQAYAASAVEEERERCMALISSKREKLRFSDQRDICDELVAEIRTPSQGGQL
jgi:hypothetical protein